MKQIQNCLSSGSKEGILFTHLFSVFLMLALLSPGRGAPATWSGLYSKEGSQAPNAGSQGEAKPDPVPLATSLPVSDSCLIFFPGEIAQIMEQSDLSVKDIAVDTL